MITEEHFNLFYGYKGSFEAFAHDFFGVETDHDITTSIVDFVGPEEVMLAHICWRLLFTQAHTFIVVCPNVRMAHHWSYMVSVAMKQFPAYVNPGLIKDVQDELLTAMGTKVMFRPCNPNLCRGMTIDTMYIVEPNMLKPSTYDEFMQSILPTMTAGRNRQVFMLSRGY